MKYFISIWLREGDENASVVLHFDNVGHHANTLEVTRSILETFEIQAVLLYTFILHMYCRSCYQINIITSDFRYVFALREEMVFGKETVAKI